MSTKYTAGPWSHRNGRIFQTDRPELTIANVARAHDGDYSPANGDLLAAATELLEAAKLVIAWYEAEDDHSKADFYERMQMCRDSEAALRAAIAKATGGQQ